MGGSTNWVEAGCWELSLGDAEAGVEHPEADSLWSFGKSVNAKLRHDGVRRGVDSPEGCGNTIVFIQRSQTPDLEVMVSLQVLQVASVLRDERRRLLPL
jgi:hypothetical protein